MTINQGIVIGRRFSYSAFKFYQNIRHQQTIHDTKLKCHYDQKLGHAVWEVIGAVREIVSESDYYLRHVCLSVYPPAWNSWASTGRIFINIDIYNNNVYLLQLSCYPVAVIILHVYKI